MRKRNAAHGDSMVVRQGAADGVQQTSRRRVLRCVGRIPGSTAAGELGAHPGRPPQRPVGAVRRRSVQQLPHRNDLVPVPCIPTGKRARTRADERPSLSGCLLSTRPSLPAIPTAPSSSKALVVGAPWARPWAQGPTVGHRPRSPRAVATIRRPKPDHPQYSIHTNNR